MTTSLYQKYRPQTFADLIGQDHIRTTLLHELQSGNVSHAYLFSGPRGVGKTTSARVLARAINCTQLKDGEPCNTCDHCTAILAGKALDIIEIDAASNTGVDTVREHIIENARVAPSHLSWKVFIIDEVHMLSTAAFNALLKTLEEPPSRTMFILATTELHKVPETIVSRCERFQFRRIEIPDMVARLQQLVQEEGRTVEDAVLTAIAKRSEGAQRDAESLLGQILVLDDEVITLDAASIVLPRSETATLLALWQAIVANDTNTALHLVSTLIDQGVFMNDFSREWIEFLRLLMIARVQGNMDALAYIDVDQKETAQLAESLKQVEAVRISQMIDRFLDADAQLSTSVIASLPIELAIVDVTAGSSMELPSTPVVATPTASKTVSEEKKKQPKPVITEQPKKNISASMTLTHEHVQQKWEALLQEMNHHNHALKLTFQVGKLVGVEDNIITLGFEHQFYKDRIEDHRNRQVIDTVLATVFAQGVTVVAIIGQEYAIHTTPVEGDNIENPSEEDVANVWDLANAAFGSAESSK